MNSDKKNLILELHKIGAIQFGEFTLKSGLHSPFYLDLRRVVAYPGLMKQIAKLIKSIACELSFDLITGIPYTALPIATLVSAQINKPLIYPRKEVKSYGTAKQIEGIFHSGQSCLVVDDVMSTGESKIEIADVLEKNGLKVKHFIVLIDRSYRGMDFLAESGYTLHSVLSVSDIISVLETEKLITRDQVHAVSTFMSYDMTTRKHSFGDRMKTSINPQTQRLAELIVRKKTNLILSLDVEDQKSFFNILERVADEIVMVKTHVDILADFDGTFSQRLKKLAESREFLIFEDRKFADIGSTVRHQFRKGMYRIADWADFITVHLLPGPGIMHGLFDDLNKPCSSFLLAAMSAEGHLLTESYARQVIAIAGTFKEQVSGFIGFANTASDLKKLKNKIPEEMLLLTPGVNLKSKGDGLGQQYISVEEAIRGGADAIIVGRGIYAAEDPVRTASEYRIRAWNAFKRQAL